MSTNKIILASLGVAAGLGVAMAPISAFADDEVTDTLKITIAEACTIVADDVTRAAGSDGAALSDPTNGEGLTGTHEITMENGTKKSLGSTTINVTCNKQGGFKITATANPLTGASTGETIPNSATALTDATTSGYTYTTESGTVAAVEGKHDAVAFGGVSPAVIYASGETVSDHDVEIAYEAAVDATQEADVYTGTVVYTLVKSL